MPNLTRLPRFALVLALATQAACAPAAPDAGKPTRKLLDPAQSDAPAPVGSNAPTPDEYALVKATFRKMQDAGETVAFEGPTFHPDRDPPPGYEHGQACPPGAGCVIDLVDCSPSGSEFLGVDGDGSDAMSRRADTAYEVVRLEAMLKASGYPASAWQPLLSRYEQESLQAIASGPPPAQAAPVDEWSEGPPGPENLVQESIRDALNAYRAQQAPQLPEIIVEGGCGAGDVGIHVATSPIGGRSRFIPVFYHRLCTARGVNPDDTNACDYWKEPADGVLFDVAGDYRYRVDWPDGSKREGKFSFTNLEDGQTVTIRKP